MTTIPVNPNAVTNINSFQDWGDTFALNGNGGYPASYTFNTSGWTYFAINQSGYPVGYGEMVVNLAPSSYWIGGLSIGPYGQGAVVEGQGTMFNFGSSIDNTVYVGVPVDGDGTWNVYSAHNEAKLEFIHSVGAGQSISVGGYASYGGEFGTVQIDDPRQFHASVDLSYGEVILKAVEATGYWFQNDILTLFDNGHAIDSIHLAVSTTPASQNGPSNFGVTQTSLGVVIHADGTNAAGHAWAGGTALT